MAIQEIEKPARRDAPSNRIISGRYILQPEIFARIAALKPGAGGEIQLTDALIALMEEQDFWGFNFEGETYDCGDKLGFLLANVAYGLDREDIAPAFRGSLARMLLRSERSFEGDYSTPTSLSTVPDRHSGERTAA